MKWRQESMPNWRWWVQTGERLKLGMDVVACFSQHPGHPDPRSGYGRIAAALNGGSSVVRALGASDWPLSETQLCLLQLGEQTGQLGEQFVQIGHSMRQREEQRREWIGQLWYPAMVAVIGFGVLMLLLHWVIPQLRKVTASMLGEQPLPWITEHIGTLYGAITTAMLAAGAALFTGAWLAMLAANRWDRAARIREHSLQLVPLVRNLRALRREATILEQLGAYCHAGITLPEALTRLAGAYRDRWVRAQLIRFRDQLLRGVDFKQALAAFALVRADNLLLLGSAQESGHLAEAAMGIARQSAAEATWLVRQFSRMFEPLFLLGLSLAVGGLLMAYLLPLMAIFQNFDGLR